MKDFVSIKPCEVAAAIGVSEKLLWHWANDTKLLYLPARLKVIKGKARLIEAPRFERKKGLKKLQKFLQRRCPCHTNAHGGVKGKSCFTGAKKHLGRNFVVTRDVTNCYPNVSRSALRKQLISLGFRYDTAKLLSSLGTVVTPNGSHLPQGSPISSELLNLFLFNVDKKLAESVELRGTRIHRCYDDIVGSTNSIKLASALASQIEDAIQKHGLEINEKKRGQNGFQSKGGRQVVHSLDVSNSAGVSVLGEKRQDALSVAEKYVRSAKAVSSNSLEAVAATRRQLAGFICHFKQARFSNARHLERLLRQGDLHVSRALAKRGLDHNKWYVRQKCKSKYIDRPQKLASAWKKISKCIAA